VTAADRARRTEDADRLCAEAYQAAGGPDHDVALVAVGGFGRVELAPCSDWDVVLVHADGLELGDLAERVWYPLWDAGARLDHSVRSLAEMVSAADADLRVTLGLLDVRHLAGDQSLTLQLRATMLAHWRRHAPGRLPELHRMVNARHELLGELAHSSVPDLKEAAGGLRDATTMKALVATWLVDVPHVDLERCRLALLDVRDVVHEIAGRASDRVLPEMWDDLAVRLGLPDARAAQTHVRVLGRRITHLSRLTWRRVDDYLKRPAPGPRRPHLTPVAPGVAVASGEVVLTADARPDQDPVLLLRAAAEAAEQGIVLAPPTAARLARESAPLPSPWPAEARQQLIRLLSSGRGLLEVWETLEETGAVDHFLPEWELVRLLPHASEIHRFTVDRHSVEACIEASALIRTVSRPDVLVVTALLHDIGKGSLTEHSVAGAPIARGAAARMGFDAETVELIGSLVRWHLLLATTATTRDPDDPATAELVISRIGDPEALALLTALTEADARATSPKAWSSWRSRLILTLAERARIAAGSGTAPAAAGYPRVKVPSDAKRRGLALEVETLPDGSRITAIAPDRVGLMADLAATLAFQRIGIRSARVWGQDRFAVSVWEVSDEQVDERVLRERFDAIVRGRLDPGARLRPADPDVLSPSVVVRPEASTRSTVLEVRTADRPGVVFLVADALARLDVAIRSAHVDTLGPQAVDVFYLQEAAAGALTDERAAKAAHAVRAALSGNPI